MLKNIGLWIDHKKAVMVILDGRTEEIRIQESGVEKHVRFRGGARTKTPYGAQHCPAEDRTDRQYLEKLNHFYGEVISMIRTAGSVLIFGPGEAKFELEKRIVREKLSVQIAAVETADKMTRRQIAAKVRNSFNG